MSIGGGFNDYGAFPLTIVKDRYNGTYSGGKWLAFLLDSYDIPNDVGAGDSEEGNFFTYCNENGENDWYIGRGDSPQEAMDDLKRRYIKKMGQFLGRTE